MQNALKMIFGHNYFISELIFKLSVALFRTHELQKDDMVIFFLWCFRKVRFRRMQILKDGVQRVTSKCSASANGGGRITIKIFSWPNLHEREVKNMMDCRSGSIPVKPSGKFVCDMYTPSYPMLI